MRADFSAHKTVTRLCGLRSQKRSWKKFRINRQYPLLFSFAVTSRHFRGVRINQRIDSLPCPALFSMFPGRLARFLHGRGFTKLRRSACAGSNYVWIMWGWAERRGKSKCEVNEYGRDGGDGGCVNALWLYELARR